MGMKPRKKRIHACRSSQGCRRLPCRHLPEAAPPPRFLHVTITDQDGTVVDEFGVAADDASTLAAEAQIGRGCYELTELRDEATDIEERIVEAWGELVE